MKKPDTFSFTDLITGMEAAR